MSRDVVSIWSGFIFQGEVALCRAMENINRLGESFPSTYCLKIEQEEDFSLDMGEILQVFQVKAYTDHNYTKYKEAWRKLMEGNYAYNVSNNYLILQKGYLDYTKFTENIEDDRLSTNIIAGEYRLENIHSKLDAEIITILESENITYNVDDISIKRDYCSSKIYSLIKRRHITKEREQISFDEIKDWVLNSPIALTEQIFWHQITTNLFKNLQDGLELYQLDKEKYAEYIININAAINALESLSIAEMIKLLEENLIPHKKVNRKDLKNSLADFIDSESVRDVVQKAIKHINIKPDYKSFKYTKQQNDQKYEYQLTTHHDDYDFNDIAYRNRFQRDCENISTSPSSVDVDYYVTKNLNLSKDQVSEILKDQTISPEGLDVNLDWNNQLDNKSDFGFKKIEEAIKELNQDE